LPAREGARSSAPEAGEDRGTYKARYTESPVKIPSEPARI
jgi:hypothetical protein